MTIWAYALDGWAVAKEAPLLPTSLITLVVSSCLSLPRVASCCVNSLPLRASPPMRPCGIGRVWERDRSTCVLGSHVTMSMSGHVTVSIRGFCFVFEGALFCVRQPRKALCCCAPRLLVWSEVLIWVPGQGP